MCSAIARSKVPVIVAVQGYCIGLGIEIVGSADVSVASKDAEFIFREIDNGTVGGAAQALRILPPPVVRYLMFTGGTVTGEELYRMGVYNINIFTRVTHMLSRRPVEGCRWRSS